MFFETCIKPWIDCVLFISCASILIISIILSFKTRFVQIRLLPVMCKSLWVHMMSSLHPQTSKHNVVPHKALFTAMSTTLGLSTMVSPVIAIHLGGPGALIGFLLTTIFGSAATFCEVTLSLRYRKSHDDGTILGGPMQYLSQIISPFIARWYALLCLILMTAWCSAQANQLAAILASPLLGKYTISPVISGIILAIGALLVLLGGIKRIGELSSKIVPIMFFLYVGACLWIICLNIHILPHIFKSIIDSCLSPVSMASGTLVGGFMSALRWGIFKGMQANEAGVGTQTIPHSMAATNDPVGQGILSMVSTYSAGFVALISGCVALITQTWQNPDLPLGISMVAASFMQYFSYFGIVLVVICAVLFAFGTIIGNSYNGSHCFSFLSKKHSVTSYYMFCAVMIIFGALAEVEILWSMMDIVLAGAALPHVASLYLITKRNPELIKT